MRTRVILLAIAVLVVTLPASVMKAQTLAGVEQGIKPYGAYEGGNIDSISTVNGSLTLNIPLISYPQRGGRLNIGFRLEYMNPWLQPWVGACNPYTHNCGITGYNLAYEVDPSNCGYASGNHGRVCGTALGIASDFGPAIGLKYLNSQCCPQPVQYFTVTEPDGAVHELGQVSGGLWRSVDATGFVFAPTSNPTTGTLQTTGVLWDRQGNRFDTTNGVSNAKFEDPNGNLTTANANGWTDTLGRVIPTGNTSTTDLSHCPASATTASLWSPPGPNGGTSQYKSCFGAVSISFTPPDCTSMTKCQYTSATATLPVGLVLPNLSSWTFAYDNFGELTTITLPTGGTISYTWTYISGTCVAPIYIDPVSGYNSNLLPYRRAITSRTVNANDGTGPHTWNYVGNGGNGGQTVATDPLGNDTVHTETDLGSCSVYETEVDRYSGSHTSGTLLQKVATNYSYSSLPGFSFATNVVPNTITTTDALSGKVSQVTMTYDSGVPLHGGGGNILYGERLSENHYDWGNGSPGSLLRQTNTQYMALIGPNSAYYLGSNQLTLPYTIQVLDGSGNQKAFTQYNYDETSLASSGLSSSYQWDSAPPTGAYRGNNTSTYRWLNSGSLTCQSGSSGGSGSNVISHTTFFDDGNVQTATDPCNNATTSAYSLTYWAALPTTVTNALNQSTANAFDFNTGLLTSTTDPNNLTTSFSYDNMWRLAQANHPDGAVDTITHQESSFPFTATLNKQINPSQTETTTNVFDGLGRVSQTQLNSDPQGTDYTDTTYDALGRVATVSNPYRTGSDITTTTGTTTYGYDAMGRKTSETYPDNSVLTTAYCGPSTLVTDPTNRWRRSRADGLGQLVEVDEPNAVGATVNSNGCLGTGEPIWVTTYGYDTLGNLTSVLQNGSRSRSSSFDSLSRLLTSTNPEVGTITYAYWPDGPVHTKTDARGIATTYLYEALHRETSRSYSNGDPTVTTAYDGTNCLGLSACENIGHRTSMTDAAGSESWSYQVDSSNHRSAHVDQRTTSGITKTSTYYLDYARNVFQAVYPTGRAVNYSFDNADRPSQAIDGSNGITYATGFQTSPGGTCPANVTCYTPQGTFYALSIGQTSSFSGLNLTHIYNSRLQPQEFKASSTGGNAIDISYSFADPGNGNKNAGHVLSITNNLDSTRSQAFAYDQLNRLTSAWTTSTYSTSPAHCWGESFSLDSWGNLNSIAAISNSNYTGCSLESGFSSTADTNNHVPAWGYDASGNATSDGFVTNYQWDAESQLKSAAGVTYTYDGDGRRVSKSNGKLYWYDGGSEILAETDASGNTQNEYIFFGGKRIAVLSAGGNPSYYVEDLLGTSRALTTNTGVVCYDADFYPYGGERYYTNSCPQNYKFEGKERDTETGNDDFGARYYSNRFGRWLSADWSAVPAPVPYANLSNPQTLNLYAMVADDPESFADLDGHCNGNDWCGSVAGLAVGTFNFVKNTVGGLYAAAKEYADSGSETGMLIAGLKQAASTVESVEYAADQYATKGVSGVASDLAAQGREGATEVVTEAILTGGLAASSRVDSVMPEGQAPGVQKTYQTYTKTNPETGEVYAGRTSGTGTPQENVAARDSGHHMNQEGFGPAKLDKSSNNAAAIRGREQQLIDHYRSQGRSGNKINGVSPKNPNANKYRNSAKKEFGSS